MEEQFKECEWCNGTGTKTQDGYVFSTHFPCFECQGTGLDGGKEAEQKLNELLDKHHVD